MNDDGLDAAREVIRQGLARLDTEGNDNGPRKYSIKLARDRHGRVIYIVEDQLTGRDMGLQFPTRALAEAYVKKLTGRD